MAKQCQIIAIEKGIKSRSYSTITQLNKLAQKPDLFNGFSKNYNPRDDEGEPLPSEKKLVQLNAEDMLLQCAGAFSELFDVTARKDYTNCNAQADVVVNGHKLIQGAPATFLLFLEKQLTDFGTFVGNLPVLDETEIWDEDENSGLHRSGVVQTHRTKKLQKPLVLYPATDKHPAQTQLVTEDVIVGFWSTIKQSGAIPKTRKAALLERIESVLQAVKQAREEANMCDEDESAATSASLFNFLLAA